MKLNKKVLIKVSKTKRWIQNRVGAEDIFSKNISVALQDNIRNLFPNLKEKDLFIYEKPIGSVQRQS